MTLTPDQIDAAEAAALGILRELDDLIGEQNIARPFFGWGWGPIELTTEELTPVGRIALERLTTLAGGLS